MNLGAVLLEAANTAPDDAAIVAPQRETFGALAVASGRLAARLATQIEPGARVVLLAGNELAFVRAYLAILTAGGVAVPVNGASPSLELARELSVVEPAMVVASSAYADLARRACALCATEVPVFVYDGADPQQLPADPCSPVTRAADDLAVLLFTAGTAGAPKPAMLTHGSLSANLTQMQAHPGLRVGRDDVALAVLPLFHVFGLNVVLGLSLMAGGGVSLVDHFHPNETLTRVQADRVTVVAAVPAIFEAWIALDPAVAPANPFEQVRLCVSGAAPLRPELVTAMRARFAIDVHDGYGLTEASPVVTTSAIAARPRPGSVGPPLPGVEVRLTDDDGQDVLRGDPGEILVRGANVFAGYWGDPEASARVLDRDGWLHTGDIGVADDDGWLALVERVKDVVIVSGFNVYPGEVEHVIAQHADVADVAVVGEAHPRTGETIVAYVVPKPGRNPDPVELLRHTGRRLARYKLPTRVELVDELPRSFAGKLLRRELPSEAGSSPTPSDETTA
ncbi:MAG: AMP-binding protein [Acidimicrobiia bacterium]